MKSMRMLFNMISNKTLQNLTLEKDKIFRNVLTDKFKTYYKETPTAVKCIDYLNNKYPFIFPTVDHKWIFVIKIINAFYSGKMN